MKTVAFVGLVLVVLLLGGEASGQSGGGPPQYANVLKWCQGYPKFRNSNQNLNGSSIFLAVNTSALPGWLPQSHTGQIFKGRTDSDGGLDPTYTDKLTGYDDGNGGYYAWYKFVDPDSYFVRVIARFDQFDYPGNGREYKQIESSGTISN